MADLFAAALVAVGFTTYPTFGDRLPLGPAEVRSSPRVEVAVDKGPILELIIRCPRGSGIVTYSKLERVYCLPRGGCGPRLDAAISRLCN